MKISPQESCVLIVDIQERLTPALRHGAQMTAQVVRLLAGLRLLGVPALITEQYPKGLGPTLPEILAAAPDAPRFSKTAFGAMADPAVAAAVAALGRRQVIVCGAEAHVCVLQTAVDLAVAGYRPVLPVDCVASRKSLDKRVALQRACREGAILSTCESLLFEMIVSREHPRFGEILRLVR